MAEIGSTLREARMRARIDITEVESATKIRAKYLRALENEEWDLLPGPTFVSAFLRTYAEYLGLDARLLVEEYKGRQDRPDELDLPPIGAPAGRRQPRERSLGQVVSPRVVLVVVILALIAALYLLGSTGGGGDNSPAPAGTTATTTKREARSKPPPRPAASRTSVRIEPSGTVYVCLVDDRGRKPLNGATLTPGSPTPTYRARSFRLTLGNAQLRLVVNGREVAVPASSTAINFALSPAGAKRLPAGDAAGCA